MNTDGIIDAKERFVLKNVNFHTRNSITLFTLNFNSRLLFIMDGAVKIIVCFSCNGNLKLGNSIKVKADFLQTMRKNYGFIIVDRNSNFHIYQSTIKGWYRKIFRDTNFDYNECHLLINRFDNLLISNTTNQKLKFWDKSAGWQCKTLDIGSQVKGFCFTAQEDSLIVQRLDDICILRNQSNNWEIIQVFHNIRGTSISLIKDDTLAIIKIKKIEKARIQIFQLNQTNNVLQFISDHHIAGQNMGLFGIDFIKETNQLFVKFGNYVTIFKINDKRELVVQSKYWLKKNCIDELQINVSQKGDFLVLCHQFENLSICSFDDFYVMQIKILRKL